MNKRDIIAKYGHERIKIMHYFLDKINRFYGFPYSKENLYDFVVSLEKYTKEDLGKALEYLEDRESTYPLKFNEIKSACKDARSLRKKHETMGDQEEIAPVPMPPKIREFLDKILRKKFKLK